MLTIFYAIFLILMFAQGLAILYFNLYIWLDPERMERSASPDEYVKPKMKFTVMLPAYHEEAVLGDTIKRVAKQNYPKSRYEILVILQPSDTGTIKVAKDAIKEAKIKNARVLTVDPDHTPLNKPYQLNYALEHTKFETLVIYDSEDDVHVDMLNIANTFFAQNDIDILQCGTQLMNYDSPWFASHNVLEYFFWWKSRVHAHMKIGAVPLGGNSVFFKTDQVRKVGGWNENCLCEDAEIGMRLSIQGSKMMATYDARHVTREETPHTIEQFIKQRTRWSQGFIQVIKYGYWRQLDSWKKVALSAYLLGFPIFHALLIITTPFVVAAGLIFDLPFAISVFSFLPLFMVFALITIHLVGLYEFIREQNLPLKPQVFVVLVLTFIPYQIMLGVGAIRATYREFKGQNNWEKTDHSGAHRKTGAS